MEPLAASRIKTRISGTARQAVLAAQRRRSHENSATPRPGARTYQEQSQFTMINAIWEEGQP